MSRITAECEARIKQSVDIVDLLGRYIEVRRAGTAWKACCPFHQEKTPSFHINPARQSYHCFGCGVGGDGIKFLMEFENLSYPDALRRLADLSGIPIIEEEENPEVARRRKQRQRVVQLNNLAADYYHRLLCRSPEAAHVREYLKKRQINIEMARAWKLGWAPRGFDDFARYAASQNFNQQQMADAYLLGKGDRGYYPVFRDRLMFPIMNVRGEVVGFSGRVMNEDGDPRKYVNTAETAAFRKSELLFGLNKATSAIGKRDMTVLLCEGQIDVIACHEKADLRHAVAALGTAFTDEHAAMLRKYAKRAVLCYDGDNAGINAAEKTYRRLAAAGIEVFQACLPLGEDPDSLIENKGAQQLSDLVAQARPYLESRCAQELPRIGSDASAKAQFIAQLIELVADITDETRRDIAIVDIATRTHTGIEMLRERVADILQARKKQPQSSRRQSNEAEFSPESIAMSAPVVQAVKMHPSIRGLLQLAILDVTTQRMLVERIEDLHEVMQELEGGQLLLRFFEVLPSPGDEKEWQAYIAMLRPEEAAALDGLDRTVIEIENPVDHCALACEKAARTLILRKIDTLKAQLYNPDLSTQLQQEYLSEIAELRLMLEQ